VNEEVGEKYEDSFSSVHINYMDIFYLCNVYESSAVNIKFGDYFKYFHGYFV